MNQDDIVYIYILVDPNTDEIRYVGATCDVKGRYNQHVHSFGRSPKYKWIESLKQLDQKPYMEVIDRCSDSSRKEIEMYWIRFFLSLGCDLLNVSGNPNRPHVRHVPKPEF